MGRESFLHICNLHDIAHWLHLSRKKCTHGSLYTFYILLFFHLIKYSGQSNLSAHRAYCLPFNKGWLVLQIPPSGHFGSVQSLSPVRLCDPMKRSTPGLPVHHQLPEFTQTHVHWVSDAIQPSHPLLSPSPPALNLSQHQGLFQQVNSSHQVTKVLEFQHQSFQWTPRTDLL